MSCSEEIGGEGGKGAHDRLHVPQPESFDFAALYSNARTKQYAGAILSRSRASLSVGPCTV